MYQNLIAFGSYDHFFCFTACKLYLVEIKNSINKKLQWKGHSCPFQCNFSFIALSHEIQAHTAFAVSHDIQLLFF